VYYHCSALGLSQWNHPRIERRSDFKRVGKALMKGKLEEPPSQHSVYDARSRHVDLPTPESLSSDDGASPVMREQLLPRAFALHGLLSSSEAASYVASSAAHGFEESDIEREFPSDVRNNSRLIHFSDTLAAALWRRLAPHLLHRDIFLIQPMGYAAEGRWKPVGVNPCFRIGRYNEGEHFAAHRDGMYVNDNGESSIYSIVLYLNDDFEGGELEMPEDILFYPLAGSAVLFPHDTLHTARAPTRGTKYVARSELMFRCVDAGPAPSEPKFVYDPLFQRMAALYAQVGDLASSGDAAKTTATYQEALGIQIAHKGTGDAAVADSKLPIATELVARALSFLTPPEVLATATVNSSWQAATTAGLIWRTPCQHRWPKCDAVIEDTFNKLNPELKDWFGLYKQMHLMSKSTARVCTVFLNEKLEGGTNSPKPSMGLDKMNAVPAWAYHRESGHPWDSSMKQRRGWEVGCTWRKWDSWFHDKLVNWDMLPELFKHAFTCLKVEPATWRVLIPALPGVLSQAERVRLSRILTCRFEVPKVCIAPAPLCALLSHNMSTGTVVWGCSMGRSIVSCYVDGEEVTVAGSFKFDSGTPEDIAELLQRAAADLGEGKERQALENVVFSVHGPPKLEKRRSRRSRYEPEEPVEVEAPPAWTQVDEVKKLLPFSTELHAAVEGDVVAGGKVLATMPNLLAAFEVKPEVCPRDEDSWEWRLLANRKWQKLPNYCTTVLETSFQQGQKSAHIQLANFQYLVANLENFTAGMNGTIYRRWHGRNPEATQTCRLTRFRKGHPSSIPDTRIPMATEMDAGEKMDMAVVEEVAEAEALHVRTMAGRVVLSMAKSNVHKIGSSVQDLQEEISDRCYVSSKQVALLLDGRELESTEILQPILEETAGAVELLLLVREKPKEKKRRLEEVMLEDWPGECVDLRPLEICLRY